jgi:lipopolysaccharide/colanic/teichoic acid biosynthesis glycosyltransferase
MNNSKKIMLIDLHFRAYELKNHGFQVNDCASVIDAISEFYSFRNEKSSYPEVVLVNSNRMQINEITWFKNIVAKNDLKIPIIIMHHDPKPVEVSQYRNIGIWDYLNENCAIDTLCNHINVIAYKPSNTFENKNKQLKKKSISLTKRTFDIALSLLLLIALSPLFLLVIIAIRLESKGAVFYYQKRVGTGYKTFNFHKFRSMKIDAEKMLDDLNQIDHYNQHKTSVPSIPKEGLANLLIGDDQFISECNVISRREISDNKSFNKFENDPRITKVGRWIRKTSIDELPQLFNVLIGDMSLVGNRPLPLYEAETLTSDKWAKRFMAPAGITGLWQVTERGRKSTSVDSRKQLDIDYAQKHNFLMDLKILFKTPLAAIQHENV